MQITDQFCYFNNGLSFRMVPSGYAPQSGEQIFSSAQNPTQLATAFSGYTSAANAAAAQIAASAAITGGVTLISTGTSALNGTYACNLGATANINAVITYILVNGTFPGGGSTMPWLDTSGTPHVFPDVDHFKNFASAVANFVAQVTLYGDSGGSIGSLPSNAITIA